MNFGLGAFPAPSLSSPSLPLPPVPPLFSPALRRGTPLNQLKVSVGEHYKARFSGFQSGTPAGNEFGALLSWQSLSVFQWTYYQIRQLGGGDSVLLAAEGV